MTFCGMQEKAILLNDERNHHPFETGIVVQ